MRQRRQLQVLFVFIFVYTSLLLLVNRFYINGLNPICATSTLNASSPTHIFSSWHQFQASCDPSYIVIDPVNGLGNRILSIASAIAYGIVTKRGVRVHWGEDFPARLSDVFDARDDRLGSWELSRWAEVFSSPNFLWHAVRNRIREASFQSKSGTWSFYFDEEITCERQDSLLRFGYAEWVRTDQYFVPALEANAAHRWIRFDDRGKGFLFHAFWNLMRPAMDILDAVEAFRKKAPGKDKAVWIGVHARRLEGFRIPVEWYAAAARAAAAGLASSGSPASSETPPVTVYFLASDHVSFYTEFAAQVQHPSERVLFYSDSPASRTSAEGVKRAMTELVLLGTSDVVVGTEHSTFSMVASSISGTNPFVVYRNKDTYGYRRLNTSEPCYMHSRIDTYCGVPVPLRRSELIC